MKKISAVLLVLVLVGSVVFAGFTGSATTGFGYNFDTTDYGFMGIGTPVSVDLNFLSVIGEAAGEGDVYASIKATLDFSFSNADADDVDAGNESGSESDVVTKMIVDLDFDHAKIVGDNWYVGILGSLNAPNFATSAVDSADVPNANNPLGFSVDDSSQKADLRPLDYVTKNSAGVEVGYMDYVLSLGLTGNADAGTYNVFGTVATPDYELADGVTAKFGAAGLLSDAKKAVSGSAKVGYEADEFKASVATDMIYSGGFMFDVAVAAAYDIVSADVYFATDANRGGYTAVENLLSAKVVVDLDPMTVTLTGKNLINTQALSASVKYQVNEELAVTGRGGYTIDTEAWKAGADVEYKAADYIAKLGGTYNSNKKVQLNASVESATLVPGATLKIAYAGDDLTEVDAATESKGNLGKVVASVKIAF